ncbi:hypothetical protein AHF37_06079, partial [Paragonimus kellicotti]
TQFATLLPLADWLRLNEPRNPDACRDPKVEALTNRMLEAWTQALDRATQLEFFQQLVKLPNGLGVLIQQLCALEHQLRAEDTLHNSSAMELTIQQLQYQFCIEGASLSALFKRFNQVPSGSNPGSTWLGLWIDRVREAYESVVHLWELRVRQRRQHALVQSFEAWILCAEKCLDEMAQRSDFCNVGLHLCCLRRDWQMKLCHGLNRLIRAAQLVDAERFPLRPLHTIETRLDPEEMLRQEQVFLESIRFALDALHTESGILREALSVCDSQATTSPMALSLNGTMEELKHLLTRMLHDPRLGQSCSLKMPRDKFTAYIQTRVTEGDRLYALIKLAIRTQWELVGLEELVPESDYLTQRLAEIETALQLNPKTVRGSRLKRLSLLNAKWDQWNLKYEPVNFSQYTAGFAWTPISFSSTSVQIPIVTEESVELMVLRYRQLRNRLFNTLEKLNSEAGRVEDARVVRFKIVPDELPNWPKIGCTCNSDKINVDDLETNLLQNKATDVFKHANLLRDLYASLDLHSSQHTEPHFTGDLKTERDIKNRILQARCQLDAVDHWTETIRLVQSKLEELALSSVCWQHFGRFELEHALMRLNALESYSKQTWLKARDQIPSCSRLVEWFIVRRMQLAHELCINQIRALDHQAVSPNTEHQVLNRLLADSQNGVTDLIGHLRRLMNTRLQWTNEWAAGEFPVYDLHVRLPREMDMIQLFTKLTMVERCCTQTKRRLSESTPNIPLRLPELELNNDGRSDEDAIAYSRDLLKQLVRCLYNRAWMRDCIGRTCEDAEKLRDLISTISGHVNEVRSVTHQLNVAIPTLTGFHMDELTMAVVELESMANEDRSERSNSVSAYKHSNNIGFTQHIKVSFKNRLGHFVWSIQG